jgi:hypothetical protein
MGSLNWKKRKTKNAKKTETKWHKETERLTEDRSKEDLWVSEGADEGGLG